MRVLWLCNIMLPAIAEKLHRESSVKEGWISGLLERFLKDGGKNGVQLGIAFPVDDTLGQYQDDFVWNEVCVSCYGFFEKLDEPENYQPDMEKRLKNIVEHFKPDVIHIFGTEYPHALAMAKVVENKNKLLVGMQGVISLCAEEYLAELPDTVVSRRTFRDVLKKDSILQQQAKFAARGKNEERVLHLVGNVTGRTAFDKAFCKKVNADAAYHVMNETMRPCFYNGKWELEACKKHRIFFSQADYPLKGFHFLLEALPGILEKYPDTEVVIAGNTIIRNGLMGKIKISSYGKYLAALIQKYELQNKIRFLGKLSADQMKQEYLKCHTFVCASVLENSPNSVGEAMLLGVPVISSNVGGVPSMITDRSDGLLFEKGDVNGLIEAVLEMWNPEPAAGVLYMTGKMTLAEKLGKAAAIRAKKVHDGDANFRRLVEIYRAIEQTAEKEAL